MKERIAVDIDSTLNHLAPSWIGLYNVIKGANLDWRNQPSYDMRNFIPDEDINMFFELLKTPGLFRYVPVYPGARHYMEKLNENYDLWIVTMRPPIGQIMEDKIFWLKNNFPFLNERQFVFTGNKSIIKAEYMIDDCPEYLMDFAKNNPQGTGICIEQPYNKNIHFTERNIVRKSTWKEIESFLN